MAGRAVTRAHRFLRRAPSLLTAVALAGSICAPAWAQGWAEVPGDASGSSQRLDARTGSLPGSLPTSSPVGIRWAAVASGGQFSRSPAPQSAAQPPQSRGGDDAGDESREATGVPWSALSQEQRELLSKYEAGWDQMPLGRQRAMAAGARRWLNLSPERREEARRRMEHWRSLDPQQRRELRRRYDEFRELPPQEQARLRRSFHDFQHLSPEQRREMRERFRKLPPEERRRLKEEWHHEHHGQDRGQHERPHQGEHQDPRQDNLRLSIPHRDAPGQRGADDRGRRTPLDPVLGERSSPEGGGPDRPSQ